MSHQELKLVREYLTYKDSKVTFAIKKLKESRWYNDGDKDKLETLKAQETQCLLKQDTNGQYWCLSGVRDYLEKAFRTTTTSSLILPSPNEMDWKEPLPFKLYPYQEEAVDALFKENLARVSLATGTGKSMCALELTRRLGLKTVIVAPSTSITEQLLADFTKHLSKSNVGAFYASKKDFKKQIVIGTAQSFTRLTPKDEAWKHLSKADVCIFDESHSCAASTIKSICLGLLASATRRYFFSATQIRGDGLGVLLDGLTGHTVASLTSEDAMNQGYLAKISFKIIKTKSDSPEKDSDDPNAKTRKHLYYNPRVLKQAAAIINGAVEYQKHQVLVLIDEIAQFQRLLPLINHPCRFAHGPLGDNKDKVPEEYRESNTTQLVSEFNDGKFPILIGTSCVSTGTNFKPVKTCIYLKGGKSEVELKQGIGRCTRLVPRKTHCNVYDFDVENIQTLHRHTKARAKVMREIYPDLEYLSFDL